jgi:uncharacterized FlaG/YvyC family protein
VKDHALEPVTGLSARTPTRDRRPPAAAPAVPPVRLVEASDPADARERLEQEYAVARRVIEELQAAQVNLRFAVDERTRLVRIEVRAGDGTIIREIPPGRLLDALAGNAGLILDTVG